MGTAQYNGQLVETWTSMAIVMITQREATSTVRETCVIFENTLNFHVQDASGNTNNKSFYSDISERMGLFSNRVTSGFIYKVA